MKTKVSDIVGSKMFLYEELEFDYDGPMASKFLAQRSKKGSSRNSSRPLEKGLLSKLVKFARTRKHNEKSERPTSVCSKCSRISFDSSKKCIRWTKTRDDVSSQGADFAALQPYCEILGSFLCSHCSLEKMKQNHLQHLPAIFGPSQSTKPREADSTSKEKLKNIGYKGDESGSTARANTPNSLIWTETEALVSGRRLNPLRVEIERLSALPQLIGKQKFEMLQWQKVELQARQRSDTMNLELSTISTSLSSSMARYLVDVSPRKLTRLKKLRAPCNTPFEGVDLPKSKQIKPLDVIDLAYKLKSLYRERNMPAETFRYVSGYESFVSTHSWSETGSEKNREDGQGSERSFFLVEEEESYRKLTLSPLKIDIIDSALIQDKISS